MFEIGRVCMKTAGREAGRYCVVLNKVDEDFVLITGPRVITKVKRRRCNIKHLEPVPIKLDIKKEASDEEVMKAYEKVDVYKKLGIEKPSKEEIKLAEERKEKKKEKKEEIKKPEKEEKKKKEVKPEKRLKVKKPREKKEKPKEVKKGKKPEKPKGKKKHGKEK